MRRVVPSIATGVVVAMIACNGGGGDGCETNPGAQLRFFIKGFTQPSVNKTSVTDIGYSLFDVLPMPGVALPSTRVDFVVPGASLAPVDVHLLGRQVEAHLFTVDLDGLNSSLRAIQAGSTVNFWDALVSESARGRDVFLPFPPNQSWPPTVRLEFDPLVTNFWPASSPGLPASAPSGTGSVKNAMILHPGLCSNTQLLSPLLSTFSTQFFDQIAGIADKADGTALRNYSRATARIDLAPLPGGGFFYFFEYATTGSGLINFNMAGNIEYKFGLENGLLSLDATINDLLFSPIIHAACPAFTGGLQCRDFFVQLLRDPVLGIPGIFLQTAQMSQSVPSPVPILFANVCAPSGDATLNARTVASIVARDGALSLGLSAGDAAAVLATVADPAHWFCVDNLGKIVPFGGTARFTLRARRIEVYPDAVELVWFDRYDTTATGFALYCMLHQLAATIPGGPFGSLLGSLCGGRRTFNPAIQEPPDRPLVSIARPPRECAAPPCGAF